MILIAGPYRSGTGDDPARMAANVAEMERFALPLFRAGHTPIVGEWLALPLERHRPKHGVGVPKRVESLDHVHKPRG